MKEIDGAMGEGGGQILRTSLSLAAMLGQPVRIRNIRANRGRPGLMRQHLTGVRALAEICDAKLQGAELHSPELVFEPTGIRGGDYRFAVGSAGSVVLVAQTILPVLLKATEPSTVRIEGGTHVPGAPTFEFFNEVFLPQLRLMGCDVTATLERHGFFPAGGGSIKLSIVPLTEAKPYAMLETGELLSAEITAIYCDIDRKIAQAEADMIAHQVVALNPIVMVREADAVCAGNAVWLTLRFENITEIFSAIGMVERSRKEVAQEVMRRYKNYRKAGQPVGYFLADQLLLPIFHLGDYGIFRTCPWSLHARTNLAVLSSFKNIFEYETRPIENGIEFETAEECTFFFRNLEKKRSKQKSSVVLSDSESNTKGENENEMD